MCLCVSAVEGMKVVEIEKCRNDIKKLREEMVSRNNRWLRNNNKITIIKTTANVG